MRRRENNEFDAQCFGDGAAVSIVSTFRIVQTPAIKYHAHTVPTLQFAMPHLQYLEKANQRTNSG
jgi:hypothetical protein